MVPSPNNNLDSVTSITRVPSYRGAQLISSKLVGVLMLLRNKVSFSLSYFFIIFVQTDLDKTLDTSMGGINPGGLSISEIINFDRGGIWA